MKTCHIVLPCYNENDAIVILLKQIRDKITDLNVLVKAVIVDDASTDDTVQKINAVKPSIESSFFQITIVSLVLNQGHQNAIYAGLSYCNQDNAEKIIVMDSDGEDDPEAIPELFSLSQQAKIVLVNRGKRKEKLAFKIGYTSYKYLFKMLTGATLNFGNFSIVDKDVLKIILSNNKFIHYASMLSKLKAPKAHITYNRRKRIDGKSKMSYSNLILHGIKSFVEYAEELLINVLKFFVLTIGVFLISIGWVVYEKLFTDNAIPGWAGTLSLLLLMASIISLGFFVTGIFLLKISNNQKTNPINYEIK
jgi:glycosyltransferase involved in cell wall biosynthesis